jgi:hypothetical protein
MNIYVDPKMSDDSRRQELYRGAIVVHSPGPSALALCRLARELVEEAFRPLDPLTLHQTLPAEKCAEILGMVKPKFIHHPDAKRHIRGMLSDLGCDPAKTYFDVPRLRTAFPGDYLKSGIAYAFHAHRDTWYSAPFCQVNWWMPVYEVNADNCMALHPRYFSQPIKNGSSQYNYHKWNAESRYNAAKQVKLDTRVQPHAEEPLELEPEIRMVCPVGGAYQFSAAQLHSTAPNTSGVTRYSVDFRTVHLDDVMNRVGARNVDAACTGTTMGDYLKGTDLSHLPKEAMALYLDGTDNEYTLSPATR